MVSTGAVIDDIRIVDGKTYKCLAVDGRAALWMRIESGKLKYLVIGSQCCQPGASNETWVVRAESIEDAKKILEQYR